MPPSEPPSLPLPVSLPKPIAAEARVPEAFRPLPPDASPEQILLAHAEMSRAYATIAHGYSHQMPLITAAAEELRAELVVLNSGQRRLEGRVTTLEGTGHSVPPVASILPVAPRDLAQMVVDGVQKEILRIKVAEAEKVEELRAAAQKQSLDDARLLRIERANANRKMWMISLTALVTAAAGILTALTEHCVK